MFVMTTNVFSHGN